MTSRLVAMKVEKRVDKCDQPVTNTQPRQVIKREQEYWTARAVAPAGCRALVSNEDPIYDPRTKNAPFAGRFAEPAEAAERTRTR